MEILEVKEYLLYHTFRELEKKHGVQVSFSKNYYKFSLNYSMIDSKENDSLAKECRGLILTCDPDCKKIYNQLNLNESNKNKFLDICPGKTKILAYPFSRFFNYGQACCANIDFSDKNLSIYEKMDGTLCIVYFDPIIKEWCVGTRSCPDADLKIDGWDFTFRSLFEKALLDSHKLSFVDFTSILNKDKTYMYELTSPYNQVVVRYNLTSLTFIGIRDNLTLMENKPDKYWVSSIPLAPKYNIYYIDELIKLISSLDPLVHEGVVICDSKFNRVKLKNVNYVLYHRAKDLLTSSPRNCLEIILRGKDDDLLSIVADEIADKVRDMKRKLSLFIDKYLTPENFDEKIKLYLSFM